MTGAARFAPEGMPARDAHGWATHPDVETLLEDGGEDDDLFIDAAKLQAAGLEAAYVLLDEQAGDGDLAWVEYFEQDGSASLWQPAPPDGEGWQLVAVYDTELAGPAAMFVRPLGATAVGA